MVGVEWADQPTSCVNVNGAFGVKEGVLPRVCGYL